MQFLRSLLQNASGKAFNPTWIVLCDSANSSWGFNTENFLVFSDSRVSCASRGEIRLWLEMVMQYDRIDARILEIVQKNNRLTSDVIGEMAGLSPTACQRRLKRLRSEGIIQADVSVVSPKAVGRPIQVLALVTLERESADIIDRFKKAIKTSTEVVNGFYVTGDADFVLYITARSMEEYEEFTRRFFYQNRDIEGFKTMVILDRVKVGFAIPVELPPDD
ncbi:Lrp/AsnC family leucine-responsive transcriptional regulator [Bradyrhizobium sp. USDA 4529]